MLTRIRFSLRALRNRNLRLFFAGQGFSMVGAWMQHVAVGWLVYRLTGSALMLGVIGFCSQFPTFLVAPFAGALADRWSRYRMVVSAQVLSMLQAGLLAALVLGGAARVWHLVVLSVVLGLVSGLDVPARQALLVRLVRESEDLPNAIALNSALFNAARLVGPAVAGVLIGLTGEGPIFLINTLSYVPVLVALWAMDIRPTLRPPKPPPSVLSAMREGFAYAFGFAPVRDVLLLLAMISLVGIPYAVLLPVIARDVLGGDARTLGLLTSAAGLGALFGTFYLASRSTVRGLGRVSAVTTAVFGAALVAFSFSRDVRLSVAVVLVIGFGVVVATAAINTILQTLVEEDMRGRMMSLYTMAFVGMSPLGSLLGGTMADRVGAPQTIGVGGVACIGAAIWFAWRVPALREIVRPIYVRRGIIPEVASGLQTASELRPKA